MTKEDSLALAINVIAKATNLSAKEVTKRIDGWEMDSNKERSQKLLTKKEVAGWLHISLPTVDRYLKRGLLEKVSLSKQAVRISETSVQDFIKNSIYGITEEAEEADNSSEPCPEFLF